MVKKIFRPLFVAFLVLGVSLPWQMTSSWFKQAKNYFFDTADALVQKALVPAAHTVIKEFLSDVEMCVRDRNQLFVHVVNKYETRMKEENRIRIKKIAEGLDGIRKNFPRFSRFIVTWIYGQVAFANIVKKLILSLPDQRRFDEKILALYEEKTKSFAQSSVSLKDPENYTQFKKYAYTIAFGGLLAGIGIAAYYALCVAKNK